MIPFCYFSAPRSACVSFHHIRIPLTLFFCFKADEDSMKIICVLFIPKLRFRHSYYSEKLQHFLIDSNFFQAVTRKQRIFILNNKQEQEINY